MAGSHTEIRVLVVDDDKNVLDLIRTMLETLGIEVFTVLNGSAALAVLAKKEISILILDLGIPGIGGWDLLRQIRKNTRWQRLPVMICTSSRHKEDILQARQIGTQEYLLKPFNRSMFLAKFKNLLNIILSAPKAAVPVFAQEKTAAEARATARTKASNNSLIAREVICQVCEGPPFIAFGLRHRSQIIERDFFDLSRYKPAPGRDLCHYFLLEPWVCPSCLFTSTESHLWCPADRESDSYEKMADGLRTTLRRLTPEANRLLSTPGTMFEETRTPAEAVVAYRLAHLFTRQLHENERTDRHYPWLLGEYDLQIASLAVSLRDSDLESLFLEQAKVDLQQAYSEVIHPELWRGLYQLVALSLYLGDGKTAEQYTERLRQLAGNSRLGVQQIVTARAFLEKAKGALARREEVRRRR